jgi:hypothetical protein
MHRPGWSATVVAQRAEPLIGFNLDQGRVCVIAMYGLSNHFDSLKWEVCGYTQSGHLANPFVSQGLLDKELDVRKAA